MQLFKEYWPGAGISAVSPRFLSPTAAFDAKEQHDELVLAGNDNYVTIK